MLYYCVRSLLLWSMNSACAVGHTETGFCCLLRSTAFSAFFCNVFPWSNPIPPAADNRLGGNLFEIDFFLSFSFRIFSLLSSVRLNGMRKWRRRHRRSRAYKISTAAVCNCKSQCQGKKRILIWCGIFPLDLLLSFLDSSSEIKTRTLRRPRLSLCWLFQATRMLASLFSTRDSWSRQDESSGYNITFKWDQHCACFQHARRRSFTNTNILLSSLHGSPRKDVKNTREKLNIFLLLCRLCRRESAQGRRKTAKKQK